MANSGYIPKLNPLSESSVAAQPITQKNNTVDLQKSNTDNFTTPQKESSLSTKDQSTPTINASTFVDLDNVGELPDLRPRTRLIETKSLLIQEKEETSSIAQKLRKKHPKLTLTEFSKLLNYLASKDKRDPDVKKIVNFVNQHINDFQKTMSELLTTAIKTETDPKKKAELEKVQKTIAEIESFKDKPEEILKQIESNPVLKEALGFFLQNAIREVEGAELTLEQPKQQELNRKLLNTVIRDETTLSVVAEEIFRANPILANNTFGAENARSLLHLLFEQRKQQKSQEAEKSKKQEEEKRAEETKIQAEKEREIKITEKKSRELRQQEELKASLAPGSKHYAKLAQILGRKGFLDLADYLSVGGRDLIQTLVNNGTLKDPRALEYLQQSSDNIFSQPTKRPQLLV